jgi:DNA adenine methylase
LYRTNKSGDFNVPFGHYNLMALDPNVLIEFSLLIKNVLFSCCDYTCCLSSIGGGDAIYLDPPYFGKNMFNSYLKEGFCYLKFFNFIEKLKNKNICYLLSNVYNEEFLSFFFDNKYNIFNLE